MMEWQKRKEEGQKPQQGKHVEIKEEKDKINKVNLTWKGKGRTKNLLQQQLKEMGKERMGLAQRVRGEREEKQEWLKKKNGNFIF